MDYGRITKFDSDRAFGFIAPDRGGQDIFFHISGVDRTADPRALRPGTQVSYEEQTGPKGVKAGRVKILASRPEDAWPEYAAEAPQAAGAQHEVDDIWAEASQAAYEAFCAVLKAKGLL